MNNNYRDQADGLRRMFDSASLGIVAFAAGSANVGKSVLIANLAFVLTRQGKNVLLLDESVDKALATCFGRQAQYDLDEVITGQRDLAHVLVEVMPGARVLPLARLIHRLNALDDKERQKLIEVFSGISPMPDIILVDTSLDHPLGFSPFGLAIDDTVIVMSVSGSSITDTYALIKKASLAYAKRNYRILVNKARNFDEAAGIFGNLAEVSLDRKVARLEYAGSIPQDEGIRQAARLGQPVENIFPDSPAVIAFEKLANQLSESHASVNSAKGMEDFVQHLLHFGQSIDPVAIYA